MRFKAIVAIAIAALSADISKATDFKKSVYSFGFLQYVTYEYQLPNIGVDYPNNYPIQDEFSIKNVFSDMAKNYSSYGFSLYSGSYLIQASSPVSTMGVVKNGVPLGDEQIQNADTWSQGCRTSGNCQYNINEIFNGGTAIQVFTDTVPDSASFSIGGQSASSSDLFHDESSQSVGTFTYSVNPPAGCPITTGALDDPCIPVVYPANPLAGQPNLENVTLRNANITTVSSGYFGNISLGDSLNAQQLSDIQLGDYNLSYTADDDVNAHSFDLRLTFVSDTGPKIAPVLPGWSSLVPEPTSWALFMSGFGLVGVTLRQRRNRCEKCQG